MFRKWFERICWYYRNSSEIERLDKIRSYRIRNQFKHMYCKLHESMDCSHSTWSSDAYNAEVKKIDDWYKAELKKLK